MKYGYNDPNLVKRADKWTKGKVISLILAIFLIAAIWLFLNQKLLLGGQWISATYDNPDWYTNEGGLHTYGAWDFEAHVWKTQYIMDNFPHFSWNPYWYMGMPLLKYYQTAFYALHILTIIVTGISAARAALYLVIFGHLFATLLTFLLCYKVSRRIWAAALPALFLLPSTFITLRSYGWEPISIVFIFLYPLGLLLFLKEPLRPFRLGLILTLAVIYLSHPLIFFSLCMFMGIYLSSIAVRERKLDKEVKNKHYIWSYFALVFTSILLAAVQFLPQITYDQQTSGAHMGVSYIPYYHVPFNVIPLWQFLFDAGNLKGPGFIIMVAFALMITFGIYSYVKKEKFGKQLLNHELVAGIICVLITMILFYYFEVYKIFPMNQLRSIQYHRIIPEFIITASVLISALSNIIYWKKQKIVYYAIIAAFLTASMLITYNVQSQWKTTNSIENSPEFIYSNISGRISFPYTDQSLAVRNSFTYLHQTYGYYEQGIINKYADEVFSVSSGYHSKELTLLYLKAADVTRLYINKEEGAADEIISKLFINETLYDENGRYVYYIIPVYDPSFSQAVDAGQAEKVKALEPGCRILFKEQYCGSKREEFVSSDLEEIRYLEAYVNLMETPYTAHAEMNMINPDEYRIKISNAGKDTAVVIKMSYDPDFSAKINGHKLRIEEFGPDFMLIIPEKEGDYEILLKYHLSKPVFIGGIVSLVSLACVLIYFAARKKRTKRPIFNGGNLYG